MMHHRIVYIYIYMYIHIYILFNNHITRVAMPSLISRDIYYMYMHIPSLQVAISHAISHTYIGPPGARAANK